VARCVCGPLVTASCCVVFGRVIGKKVPIFIKVLIDQPFAVGEGGVLGFAQVIQKGAIDR